MPTGVPVDRAALHRILFRRTDRRRQMQIHQEYLAEELGLSRYHLSRLLNDLVRQGRIRKIASDRYNVGKYQIYDPADFPR